jgi:vancomycin resistance protein VanW
MKCAVPARFANEAPVLKADHPLRQALSRNLRNLARGAADLASGPKFAYELSAGPLDFEIKRHVTPIQRRLQGVPDEFFLGKKPNLALACKALNGLLIWPGETFSFWRLVGPPKESRGFKLGLVISGGRPGQGLGGGLCQVSNGLHWLALHSQLRVIERHRHSFDLFPDDGRQVPFGTGATVVYRFRDLRLFNPGPLIFQIQLSLDVKNLVLRLLTSAKPEALYEVLERDASFERTDQGVVRKNRIVRRVIGGGEEETLFSNRYACLYEV